MTNESHQLVNVGPADEARGAVHEKLQAEIIALIEQAMADEGVVAAGERLHAAEKRREELQAASGNLMERAARLRRESEATLAQAQATLLKAVVNEAEIQAAIGAATGRKEAQGFVLQTIELLHLHEQPVATIREMYARAQYIRLRARAINNIAQERLNETLEALSAVVGREGMIGVDPRSTLSGSLITMAQGWIAESEEICRTAAGLVGKYLKQCEVLKQIPIQEVYGFE